jgi:hypothetical protein
MRFLNYLVLLALISCSGAEIKQDLSESPYQTSGIEQFFLPELPTWANFSASGACFKKRSFQYLDMPKVNASYGLNYADLIELQAQYNERLENYFRSTSMRFVKPVEEAAFFSNTLENVRAGVKGLKLPASVTKVDVIWLDRYIALNLVDQIKRMSQTGRFDERAPILFSACMSKQDLQQWLVEKGFDQVGFYSITGEWLSPFATDLTSRPSLHLELKKILNPQIEVRLISPEEIPLPTEIVL